MDDIRLAPVAVYNTQLEADLVVARLSDAGVTAYVRSDGLGGTFPGMPMATGGFQVMVAEADQQRGRAIVFEQGAQAVDRASGSLQGSQWRVARWLVPIAAALIVLGGALRRLL